MTTKPSLIPADVPARIDAALLSLAHARARFMAAAAACEASAGALRATRSHPTYALRTEEDAPHGQAIALANAVQSDAPGSIADTLRDAALHLDFAAGRLHLADDGHLYTTAEATEAGLLG